MVLAGITLFNPDMEILEKNIAAILGQVDKLICVDNGSNAIVQIERFINAKFPNVHLIKNMTNIGIATALNQIFQYADKEGYEWVLTLDQDSVCPDNIISEYLKYLDTPQLGCLCPVIMDRNYENRDFLEDEYAIMDKCITSATFTSVDVWKSVGGFLDELFIDFVDHDFSAKLIEHDYEILRINAVKLEHEIGRGETHKFLGKQITVLNHAPFRKYYMTRNWIYYMKTHKRVINSAEERMKFIFFFLKTFLYENERCAKLKEMFRGVKDAKVLCEKSNDRSSI